MARGKELRRCITGEERAFVKREAVDFCREAFEEVYEAWRQAWLDSPTGEKLPEVVIDWQGWKVWLNDPEESARRRLVDPRALPEFSRLTGMGEKVVPFIMELMMEEPDRHFVLLLLYDEIMKDEGVRVMGFMSEPARAVKTVKAWVAAQG